MSQDAKSADRLSDIESRVQRLVASPQDQRWLVVEVKRLRKAVSHAQTNEVRWREEALALRAKLPTEEKPNE